MNPRLLLTVFCLSPFLSLPAQSRLFIENGCAVNTAEMGKNAYVFEPNDEAVAIITAIMDANFLEPNFVIRSGDVKNAVAMVEKGQRYIIYNTTYIERVREGTGTDWGSIFVFAHEIGHHLSNHRFDLTDTDARHEQELKADLFAGGMMYRLGASLPEAQTGIRNIADENGSVSHPPRRARLEAAASGWKKAQIKSPAQPERFRLPAAAAAEKDKPSTTDTRSDDGLVFIKGGTFTMGCTSEQQDCNDDEKPAHSVTLSDFYIGKYEVTQKLWREVMGSDLPELKFKGCDECPVERVSWNEVQEFLKKINDRNPGRQYRLPTEAEWEYAAREGGKKVLFGNGKEVANPNDFNFNTGELYKKTYSNSGTYREKTVPVGSLGSPNALGLHDMSGNVYEWCSDWYGSNYYKNSPASNPGGPISGFDRVCRGGSWVSYPHLCRVAFRLYESPGDRYDCLGFRLARTL